MGRLTRFFPQGFRARLVIAFVSVVAFALAILLAVLPSLLDEYFLQQERRNLETRARFTTQFVVTLLNEAQKRGGRSAPLLMPTIGQLTVGPVVTEALGTRDQGTLRRLSPVIALADIEVTLSEDIARGDASPIHYRLIVPASSVDIAPGQQREPLSHAIRIGFPDVYWQEQFGVDAPSRGLTVRLSNPYSFRAQTLQTLVGVMFSAAILTLVVALVVSVVLAERLTTPIRRLTGAAASLGEGDLDTRVEGLEHGAPEVAELAATFNSMADRVQESIRYVSEDRDRSREFLADVSHELRTPIAALRTFNELLRDGTVKEPATQREFLDSSRQQIERLDWFATNLLELSKLESGLVALDLRPEDLRLVVEGAVQQAEPVAQRRGIQLVAEVPRRPVRQLHDPLRLAQVLNNLIGNALKFTSRGGRVEVKLNGTADGAEIRVSDTGVGIDPQELPHIFDRFYRGSRGHQERAGGSGLGLSIVRSIMDMHGGKVSVESAVGSGTQVVVSLPKAPAATGGAAGD